MPNLLSDETLERTLETNRRVLDGPQNNPLRPPMVPFHSPAILRAVYVTSNTPTNGRWPCKLQWRNETTPIWSDFTPSITGWAVAYDGSTLRNAHRYHGQMVSVNPSDGLPVWACNLSRRWMPCVNGDAVTIPAYACLSTFGVDGSTGVWTVIRPLSANIELLFNGAEDIPVGGTGVCSYDFPLEALYESADGIPALGEEWGAGAATFKLRKGNKGYLVAGGITDGRCTVIRVPAAQVQVDFAKCLEETPTAGAAGEYAARLQVRNADGTLGDTGASIFLREGNTKGRLINGEIYACSHTGETTLHVYTVCDFNLTARNQGGASSFANTYRMEYGPDRCWTISQPQSRSARAVRILNAQETSGTLFTDVYQFVFDPANAWVVTEAAGVVTVQRSLTIREETTAKTTDTWQIDYSPATAWDVTATAAGHATVERLLNVRDGTVGVTTHTWQIDFAPAESWVVTATAAGHATVERLLTIRDGTVSVTTNTWQMDFSPAAAWVVTATAAGHATVERTLQVFEGATQKGDSNIYKMVLLDDDFDVTGSGGEISEIKLSGATETLYLLECCDGGTTLKARQFTIARGSIKTIGARATAPACA